MIRMARPLTLKDLNAIRELQPQGVDLDLERARLWPHSALAAALTQGLPFSDIGAATYVLYPNDRKKEAVGLVQARFRPGRPEADITFMAPALDAHPDAVTIWYRLLSEAVNQLGEQGCQRIYAQVTAGNGAEEVFRTAGFTMYAREDIYYLPTERMAAVPRDAGPQLLRRQRKRDTWNLLRLYTMSTPRPVQQAEGMISADGQVGKLGDWWDQTRGTGYVLDEDGFLVGAARVTRGRAANWLRLYLHPQAQTQSNELVQEVLALLRRTRPKPIYCSVRDYEGGIRGALEAAGFELSLNRSLMVKHTTARIKEPVPWRIPVLEKPAPMINTRVRATEWDTEGEVQTA